MASSPSKDVDMGDVSPAPPSPQSSVHSLSEEEQEDSAEDDLYVITRLIQKFLTPRKLPRDKFNMITKKASAKVMHEYSQKKANNKPMTVHQFLNTRRQHKISQLVDKYLKLLKQGVLK